MATIYVLGGGLSDEREVSLRSSAEVLKAIQELGYKAEFIDPRDSQRYLEASKSDMVLPILHGKYGEDGVLQQQLEERDIPFLGAGSKSSAACFDKWQTRAVLTASQVQMPEAALVSQAEYQTHPLRQAPHVLKILDGGSSIGTYIFRDTSHHGPALETIFSGKKLLLEELIEGHEVTVPILGDKALPVIEIIPPTDAEFDYENKYNGKTQELCPPQSVSAELQKQAQEVALKVHQAMDCRHFSRVDIMIDSRGQLYVLEINTIPGLTAQSLFPKAAAVSGMNKQDLVKNLLQLVARDYNLNLASF